MGEIVENLDIAVEFRIPLALTFVLGLNSNAAWLEAHGSQVEQRQEVGLDCHFGDAYVAILDPANEEDVEQQGNKVDWWQGVRSVLMNHRVKIIVMSEHLIFLLKSF